MFCIGVGTSGDFAGDASIFYAAFTAAKCIPGMSLGIMSVLFKRYFDKEDRLAGPSTAILGFCGITEGAIPYAVKDPMRIIPAHMIGGGVAAGLILSSKILSVLSQVVRYSCYRLSATQRLGYSIS